MPFICHCQYGWVPLRDLVQCLHGHGDLGFTGSALVERNAEEALILNFSFEADEVRSFQVR